MTNGSTRKVGSENVIDGSYREMNGVLDHVVCAFCSKLYFSLFR